MGAEARVFKQVQITNGSEGEKPLRFIRPKELAETNTRGLVLEGVYLGPVPSKQDPSKSDYKFETETEIVIVNNTGMLAKKMAEVPENTLTQLVYNGQDKIKSGKMAGKLAHSFDVLIAAE
jgi:hypothetical protein